LYRLNIRERLLGDGNIDIIINSVIINEKIFLKRFKSYAKLSK